MSYRSAIRDALAQEMERDPTVVLIGEDVGEAGGIFKATAGLLQQFGPRRVRDTPISEQAILGAALGAAMTGLRPVAEIMFADFLAVCWDVVVNQIAKASYMSSGELRAPLVIRATHGGGVSAGAQHSQSPENWAMAIPGLKVVAPSNPADMKGLLAASIRDNDPVLVFEHKGLLAGKGEVPDGEHVVELGRSDVRRVGSSLTIVALSAMVNVALAAAERLSDRGIEAEVIDLRCLVPLDLTTVVGSVTKTGRLMTVEENPRLAGWGAEVVSSVVEEAFYHLDVPCLRVTTPHIPLPAAPALERLAIPSEDRVFEAAVRLAAL